MVKKRRQLGWLARLLIVGGILVVIGAAVWIFLVRDSNEARIGKHLAAARRLMEQGRYNDAINYCKGNIEEISLDVYDSYWLQYQAAKNLMEAAKKAGDQSEQVNLSILMRGALSQCHRLNETDPRIVLDALKLEIDNYAVYNSIYYEGMSRSVIDEHYREVLGWTMLSSIAAQGGLEIRWYQAKINMYLARNIMDYLRAKKEMSLLDRATLSIRAQGYLGESDEILTVLSRDNTTEQKYPLERARVQLELLTLSRLILDSVPVDEEAVKRIYDSFDLAIQRFPDKVQGVLAAAKVCREYDETLAAELLQRQMEGRGRSDLVSLELARIYLALGQYNRAEALAEEVAGKKGETLPDALVILSKSYELSRRSASSGPLQPAEELLQRAVEAAASETGPVRAGYQDLLGDYYVRQNRFSDALSAYRQAFAADANSVDTLIKAAQAAVRLQRLTDARDCLNLALRLVPGHVGVRRILNLIEQGVPEDINDMIVQAEADVKAYPGDPGKLFIAADLFYQAAAGERGTERYESLRKGRDYLMQINEVNYNQLNRPVWVLRFRYSYAMGLYEEAVVDAEKAIKVGLPPDVDKVHLRKQLAEAYLAVDDVKNAMSLARGLEDSARNDTEVQLLIARIYLRDDKNSYSDRVMAQLNRALELARGDGRLLCDVLTEMASGFWQRGRANAARKETEQQARRDFDEARKDFEEAVRREPANVKAWKTYGNFMASQAESGGPNAAVTAALEVLQRALDANKGKAGTETAIHHVRYELLKSRGRTEEAEGALLTALSLAKGRGEDEITLLQLLARHYEDTGRFKEALEAYEQIRGLQPDNAYAKRGVFLMLDRTSSSGEAVGKLAAFVGGLLREAPNDAANLYLSGMLNERLRKYSEALNDYEEVARRQPGDDEAVQKVLYLMARQMGYAPNEVVDKSIDFLELIRKRGGMGGDSLRRLAELHYGKKDYDKAIGILQEMHQGRWRSVRSTVLLARCLLEGGGASGRVEADEELQRAIKNARDTAADRAALADAYSLQVKMLIDAKNLTAALEAARAAFQTYPFSEDLFARIAQLYSMGHPDSRDKMIEWVGQQMTRSRDNHLLLNMRGKLYFEAGRLNEADADLAHALEIVPGRMEPAVTRSMIWERKEDLPRAIAIMERAVSGNPDDWNGHKRLGDLYFKQGDKEKARRSYERARELHPAFEMPAF